jgi:hypothetical protein
VDPWFISTTSFGFLDTYRRAARKALRCYAWSISIIFNELLWDFSHLLEEEHAHGLPG